MDIIRQTGPKLCELDHIKHKDCDVYHRPIVNNDYIFMVEDTDISNGAPARRNLADRRV